jgi:hypothetical protein
MGIVQEWEIRTRAVRGRSAELKKTDAAVLVWATSGPGGGSANLQTTWTAFSAWKTAKPMEYQTIRVPADELESELARVWTARPANLGNNVRSSQTRPEGWTLVAYAGLDLVPPGDRVGALSGPEIQRINEAFRRAKSAVELARDALIKIQSPNGFPPQLNADQQSYIDFFGAYDANRFQKVLGNMTGLALAFKNTPRVTDYRNQAEWWKEYGGCVRANLISNAGGSVSLTGTVDILIGRGFLMRGGYAGTTDATVGTLVHEFSHGTFAAVDVPEVDAFGNFACTRESDTPGDYNFGNSTDPFHHQASQEADDKLLATHHPGYAVVNADSYAQFVRAVLQRSHG